MSKKIVILFLGACFFFLFILFSYLVHEDVFTAFDFNTTVKLQDNIGRNWDSEFSILSDVGKFEVSTVIVLAICLFLLFRKKLFAAFTAGMLYIGFHVIELFGKFFVDHPPPPQFMLRTEHILNFPQFHVRSEYSYPSGHSGRTIFISVIVLLIIWQSKKLPLVAKFALAIAVIGYDIAMLVSRVTLGEHWSTDVIGGSMLGLAFGLVTIGLLVNSRRHHDKHTGEHHERKSLLPKYKIEIKKVE